MSGAVEARPVSLAELHTKVQRRIGVALYFQILDNAYAPLTERFRAVQQGTLSRDPAHDVVTLTADLEELLTCPEDVLHRMARQGADSARCIPPSFIAHQRVAAAAEEHRRTQEGMRPRVSPGELVSQFAARGVSIRAVGGDLHVTPSEGLSDADRDVLRTHKAGIVAALASDAATVI